jgi:hypothetical protein
MKVGHLGIILVLLAIGGYYAWKKGMIGGGG